jgi:hypothetical protein
MTGSIKIPQKTPYNFQKELNEIVQEYSKKVRKIQTKVKNQEGRQG